MKNEYLLDHFQFLADQRMKIFGFYFEANAFVAGIAFDSVVLNGTEEIQIIYAMGNGLVGALFWFLDLRSLRLLGVVKHAIILDEKENVSNPEMRIFDRDLGQQRSLWQLNRIISLRFGFWMVFLAQMLFGAFIIWDFII